MPKDAAAALRFSNFGPAFVMDGSAPINR